MFREDSETKLSDDSSSIPAFSFCNPSADDFRGGTFVPNAATEEDENEIFDFLRNFLRLVLL